MGLIEQVNAQVRKVESIQQEQVSQQKSRESVLPVPTFSGMHSNSHKLPKPQKPPYFSGSEAVPKDDVASNNGYSRYRLLTTCTWKRLFRTQVIAALRRGN